MDENQLEQVWQNRKRILPSSYRIEDLESSAKEFAEKMEESSTKFMLVHTEHVGSVILRHELISEVPVELSLNFRDWDYTGTRQEFDGVKTWKYILVCSCGQSLEIVGENTPDELKSI
jgi:hypothetical protein